MPTMTLLERAHARDLRARRRHMQRKTLVVASREAT